MDRVFGDPEVMKHSSGMQSPDWVRKWLRGCLEDYHQKWGFGLWAVVEKGAREVIGYCGLSHFDDVGGRPETEIGYRLARAHWGHGFATEAARAVRDYSFQTLCLPRLIAIIDPRNVASVRVAEKIGMRYEKDVVFQGFADQVYAIGWPADNGVTQLPLPVPRERGGERDLRSSPSPWQGEGWGEGRSARIPNHLRLSEEPPPQPSPGVPGEGGSSACRKMAVRSPAPPYTNH
jgi:hypothetical protein